MADNDNIHKGHRARMLEKFSKDGIVNFHVHEILEILLYLMLPRVNTNHIAHHLIKEFGSLKNLLSASPDELRKIKGIGESAALQLRFFGCVTDYLNRMELMPKGDFSSYKTVAEYCKIHFENQSSESFSLLLLDEKYSLLHTHDIDDKKEDCYREIVRQIIKHDSRKVILAHNHVTGTANPSEADLQSTRKISEALREIEVGLSDHIIISEGEAISLRSHGFLSDIWDI